MTTDELDQLLRTASEIMAEHATELAAVIAAARLNGNVDLDSEIQRAAWRAREAIQFARNLMELRQLVQFEPSVMH
jgi:hypothetical protein